MRKLIFSIGTIIIALSIFSGVKSNDFGNGTIPKSQRLLVIGDSLTNGLYATAEQNTFVSIVSRNTGMLTARRAVPTLRDAIPLWTNLKAWQPDVVVIELGINDINGRQWNAQWKKDYQALVEDIQATGARVVVCTTFWIGIDSDNPIYALHVGLNNDIRDIARQTGATLADLWAATEGCADCVSTPDVVSYFSPHYHGDNMHPSDAGHAAIASVVTDAINGAFTSSTTNKTYYLPLVATGE